MANPNQREPRRLSDILGELFTVRGYGRLRARKELEEAWDAAVGEPLCQQTRLGEVRRGVLSVTVAHSTLLGELASFRKPALLAALRAGAPASTIYDIRFRVGALTPEINAPIQKTRPKVGEKGSDAEFRLAPSPRSSPKDQGLRRHGLEHDPLKP